MRRRGWISRGRGLRADASDSGTVGTYFACACSPPRLAGGRGAAARSRRTQGWPAKALTAFISIVYAPTIPLTWAIFADVADYSEWKLSRRFTGMVFATIGFALKSGLALGSASFLWIMQAFFQYDTKLPSAANAVTGYRFTSGIAVGLLFAICTMLLLSYPLNKLTTIQMADELAERRKRNEPQPGSA